MIPAAAHEPIGAEREIGLPVRMVTAVFLLLGTSLPAAAQMFLNNQCGTAQGLCMVNPAPVGSRCGCYTPVGPLPGQVVQPGVGFMPQAAPEVSNMCRTYRGACQVFPAPVGSGCNCFGQPGFISQ